MANKIIWIKVWGIALMQGTITLTWVIYNLYFIELITQFGFSKELGIVVLIIENLIAAFVEPIFGFISDRQIKLFGSKIPLITRGIVIASVLFITIPVIAILIENKSWWRWFFLLVIVLWSSVMAAFRAPLISLLAQCSPQDSLPKANSLVVFFQSVVGAFRFDAYNTIVSLGAGFAFTIGSISLLAAGAFLRWLNPSEVSDLNSVEVIEENSYLRLLPKLIVITIMGVGMGWTIRFLFPQVASVSTLQYGADGGKLAMMLFLITLGISSLLAGFLATKIKNYPALLLGCCSTILMINLLRYFSQLQLFLILLLLAISFSLVLNGIVPFILEVMVQNHSGLGLGMYFGGFGASLSFFDFIFFHLQNSSQAIGIMGASLSLIFVCICQICLKLLSAI